MSLENLKRNRDQISKLLQAAEATEGTSEKKSYGDDRIWKPTVDKAGNGYAVLRFLPAKNSDEIPWVRYWDHGFKGPTGQWYIENSLTSIGQQDPVGELNSRLWNSGIDADKETARRQKRRLHYVTNVLVLQDPGNPQNEGKVMLYKFGKKIYDKIMDAMQPEFASPSELYGGEDSKLEPLVNQLHDISEFTDPKNYKSYDELKAKLMRVLGEESSMGAPTMKEEMQMNEPAPAPTYETVPPITKEEVVSSTDDDDTMSYFAKLANED